MLPYYFTHMLLAILGLVLAGSGVMLTYVKKPKSWFLLHKMFTGIGTMLFLLAVVLITLFLTDLHPIVGFIGFLIGLGTLGTGIVFIYKKKKQLRLIHIWIGRISGGLLFIAIITGFIYAGIFA
jgi:hypothetical protein